VEAPVKETAAQDSKLYLVLLVDKYHNIAQNGELIPSCLSNKRVVSLSGM
jgi:hypothetical protein